MGDIPGKPLGFELVTVVVWSTIGSGPKVKGYVWPRAGATPRATIEADSFGLESRIGNVSVQGVHDSGVATHPPCSTAFAVESAGREEGEDIDTFERRGDRSILATTRVWASCIP